MIDMDSTRAGDQVWLKEGREWQRAEVVLVDPPRQRVCVTYVPGHGPRVTGWRWGRDLEPFHARL